MLLQPARGTYDLFGNEVAKKDFIVKLFSKMAQIYGFNYVETPVIENYDLFACLGNDSDVLSKELYAVTPVQANSKQNLCLRPEATASICRMVANNINAFPYKCYYYGPMFRHERPQKGRFRQFYQLGIESFGDIDPVDTIYFAFDLLSRFDINADLQLNTLGNAQERQDYIGALIDYLQKYTNDLTNDSKNRLQINPLRILDTKNEQEKQILIDAPKLIDYLKIDSKKYFDNAINQLTRLNINFTINNNLVRGLDYYNNIIFEYVSNDLGAQSAILGGGQYNILAKMTNNKKDILGCGLSIGLERLMQLTSKLDSALQKIIVIPYTHDDTKLLFYAWQVIRCIRQQNMWAVDISSRNNIKNSLKYYQDVKMCIIISQEEYSNNTVIVRDMSKRQQCLVDFDNIIDFIKQ